MNNAQYMNTSIFLQLCAGVLIPFLRAESCSANRMVACPAQVSPAAQKVEVPFSGRGMREVEKQKSRIGLLFLLCSGSIFITVKRSMLHGLGMKEWWKTVALKYVKYICMLQGSVLISLPEIKNVRLGRHRTKFYPEHTMAQILDMIWVFQSMCENAREV